MRADLEGTIAASEQVAAIQTKLNDANRLRNEHQKAGKRKLDSAEREAHTLEGRRLKEVVAEGESRLAAAQAELDTKLKALPNFIHESVPDGGEEDFRVLRSWGEPPQFDFEVRDHLAIGTALDLLDFERAAVVSGQKFYYLKNEAVLLELALQAFRSRCGDEGGFHPLRHP